MSILPIKPLVPILPSYCDDIRNYVPLPTQYYKNQHSIVRAGKFEYFLNIIDPIFKLLNIITRAKKQQICYEIEHSCYNRTLAVAEKNNIYCNWDDKQFIALYHDICYSAASKLCVEINGNTSIDLVKLMINGDLDPYKIGFMSCEEFAPDLYKPHKEHYNLVCNITTVIKTSELHTCHRCKRNQCTVEKNPCRSADEQIPLRITCTFCGNKWSG